MQEQRGVRGSVGSSARLVNPRTSEDDGPVLFALGESDMRAAFVQSLDNRITVHDDGDGFLAPKDGDAHAHLSPLGSVATQAS